MRVAIVDYGSGNLRSAAKAFERALAQSELDGKIVVSSDPETVAAADRVVLPGVGAFADCRRGLEALPGMMDALRSVVFERGRPFLGICVGMQLLARLGREHGEHAGLGWIDGEVTQIDVGRSGLKIPHMGWNELTVRVPEHPLVDGIAKGSHAYFVHSYVCPLGPQTIADAHYGERFSAVVAQGNAFGCQFHPEFTSNPRKGHPLFIAYLKAALAYRESAGKIRGAQHETV